MKIILLVGFGVVLSWPPHQPSWRSSKEPSLNAVDNARTSEELLLIGGFWEEFWAEVEKSRREREMEKSKSEAINKALKKRRQEQVDQETQERVEAYRKANPDWKCFGIEKSVEYQSCEEAGRKTKLPIKACTPGYSGLLDSDGDGWACE